MNSVLNYDSLIKETVEKDAKDGRHNPIADWTKEQQITFFQRLEGINVDYRSMSKAARWATEDGYNTTVISQKDTRPSLAQAFLQS